MFKDTLYFYISIILYSLLLFVFIQGSKKIAPLNEEEWISVKRKFIVQVDKEKGVIILNSLSDGDEGKGGRISREYYGSYQGGAGQEGLIISSAEVREEFLFFDFVKRPLPPKLSVKILGHELGILGWGHTGPVSSIVFEILGKIRDFFGSFGLGLEMFGLRILNIIILFSFALYFAGKVGKISGAPFLLSFPINFLFIHAGMLYYLVMTILTFLCFIYLEKRNFVVFNLLSVLLCLTHMRGFVIAISFAISFFLLEFLDSREYQDKDKLKEKHEDIKSFAKFLLIFSPLYILAFFIYMIPSFMGGEVYEREAFEGFDILRSFFLEFISKMIFLPQLVATRIMDFMLSGNLYHILKELGIVLKWKYFPFFSAIFNIFFFVPVFLSSIRENKFFFYFLGVYFAFSIVAVPFFFSMPWQFIPLSYLILFKTFKRLDEVKLKGQRISDYLSFVFSLIIIAISTYVFFNSEKIFKPFMLYSEHRNVMDVVSNIKKHVSEKMAGKSNIENIRILCITKSDIFYISFDCDLAGKYILFGREQEFRRRMIKISEIMDLYDILILSYQFFDLYDIIKKDNFYPVLKNDAFLVLVKKDLLFSESSEQQK